MKSVKLYSRVDDRTDEVGLVLADAPLHLNPGNQGRLLAHDLLEHQNGVRSIGSIADEIEAMGACWFVRGQTSTMSQAYGQYRRPEEDIAYELNKLFDLHLNGVPLRSTVNNTYSHEQDEVFDEIIRFSKHLMDSSHKRKHSTVLSDYCREAKHLLRSGMRKAEKRFEDPMTASRQFWAIADAIDSSIKHGVEEYQEFRLLYGKGKAYFEEMYTTY